MVFRIAFTPTFMTLFFLMGGVAQGASVIKLINKRKVAVIDAGKSDGMKKGMRVCFFKDSGKKTACGKVTRVQGGKSFVKVNPSRFKTVRKGMAAEPAGSQGKALGGMKSSKKDEFNALDVKGTWIASYEAPSTYQKLAFAPPVDGTEQATAWNQIGSPSLNLFNFGLEVGFPLAGIGMGTGLRYRSRQSSSDADYDDNQENYLRTQITEKGTGLWLTGYFSKIDLDGMWLLMGGGIDIDQSSITVAVTQFSDAGDENSLFEGKASLMTISLAGTMHITIELGDNFGILLGTRFLLPVSGAASPLAGTTIDDPTVVAASTSDANEDLDIALGYKKSAFAAEAHIGFIAIF